MILKPSAPTFAERARELNSSKESERLLVTVLKIFAAFKVQARGRKLPVASAKPATSPDES